MRAGGGHGFRGGGGASAAGGRADRLGLGGGYYDRFLQFYPGDKIALARSTQVSSNPLPTGSCDVPVDFIVTDSCVWNCR